MLLSTIVITTREENQQGLEELIINKSDPIDMLHNKSIIYVLSTHRTLTKIHNILVS